MLIYEYKVSSYLWTRHGKQVINIGGRAVEIITQMFINGFLNGPIPASFLFIFILFSLQFQYKLKKA